MKVRAFRLVLIHLLVMGVLLFLLIVGVMSWLNAYTRHEEVVTVPEMEGKTLAIAERLLHREGLECVIADSNYINGQSPGSILEYTPSANRKVKKGRTIYLTINKEHAPECLVPDVADNSSLREAEAQILTAGFQLDKPELIAGGEKDWVYEVKYNGRSLARGDKAPMGAILTLVVGEGLTRNHRIINSKEEDSDTDDYEGGAKRYR